MRTKKLLPCCVALLFSANVHPQEISAVKAENKTAVTPVEHINLNGVSMPLNIKTLAEMQRLKEEKTMREGLQAALKTSGAVSVGNIKPAQPAPSVVAVKKPVVAPVRIKSKNTAISPNTLLGVFGTTGAMTAEIQTTDRNVRTLREGEQLGKFQVRRISSNGLELATNNGGTQYVSVGAQVRF